MAAKKNKPEPMSAAEKKAAEARDNRLRSEGWGGTLTDRAEILKWGVGLIVVGTLVRFKKLPDRDGKKGGTIFLIDTDNGRECYGAPSVLLEAIGELEAGTVVYIECTGKVPTNKGNDAWMFDVRVKD
jgi:hypothetical protein